MKRAGLDALLITEEKNYIYFTGHRSQQNPIDKIRPYLFILPAEGAPILITMPFEQAHAEQATFVDDIRTYPLFGHNAVVAEALKSSLPNGGTVGAELGREQYLELSYNDFEDLKASLPNFRFKDASSTLLTLRYLKSAREVECVRRAARIAAKAQEDTFAAARAGMTEHEVSAIIRTNIMKAGGEFITFLAITTGVDLRGKKITVPTSRVIQPGDSVTIDVGVEVGGYCADISRTAIVGTPTAQQVASYKMQRELGRKCIASFRPGLTPHDIMTICKTELDRLGLATQPVGRIGHGVGIETTEYPSIALGENMKLVENVVFACNPNFVTDHGFFNCEENIAVTADGYEILSVPEAAVEPPIIAL